MRSDQLVGVPGVLLSILFAILLCSQTVFAESPSPPLSVEESALYGDAIELVRNGREEEGLRLARQGANPLAAKIVDWIALTRRNSNPAFADVEAFLRSNPQWPGRFQLYRNAEPALPEDWGPDRVLAWFGSRPPITAEGARAYSLALQQLGRVSAVREMVPLLWVSLDFDQREEERFHRSFNGFLTPEDERRRLERLLWDRRTAAANRQLQRVDSGHRHLARARIALYGNKPGVDAAIRRVPAELQSDEGLLYERAAWRQRRNRFDGVVEILNKAPMQGDHLASWWRLRKWAFWRALDRSQYTVAYQVASRHGQSEGLGFAEGEWLAGWLALAYANQPAVAVRHFERLYSGVTSPISRARGAFWAGEAQSRLGEAEEARRWYGLAAVHPTTFYGQIASQRIGSGGAAGLRVPAPVPPAEMSSFRDRELVRAIRILGQLDETRLQQQFIARLRQDAKTEADFQLIVDLAASLGRHEVSLRTAKLALRRGIDLGTLLYPTRELSGAAGPETALVLALMRQESEFYAKARSPVGALGLMQLMPATARQTARGIGLAYDRARLTSDPEYNIALGRAYLAQLLERFDGSYILALAAYNAGPSRAERWISQFGDPRSPSVDPILWIERIPFAETRNYVQRILETLVVYRQMGDPTETPWALRVSPLGS
ncbi:lytic transglycosylase domain-containing protein [Pelagibius sp.]|uniref:lytic transglycosylase domain-containing protein n=1 Tax=Pelagibius sp. TaxID=1931238 RepID=UPI003B50936F